MIKVMEAGFAPSPTPISRRLSISMQLPEPAEILDDVNGSPMIIFV